MTLLMMALLLGSFGQEKVDEAAARALIVKQADPVYPAAAKAKHVTGDVVLTVKVDPRGHVEKVRVVSGPSLLRQAAVDAVKLWEFSPEKQDGVITSFETELTVSFPAKKVEAPAAAVPAQPAPAQPAPAQPARTEYVELAVKCKRLVEARGDAAEQAAACDAAAKKGEELGGKRDSDERRAGYVYAATAMIRNQQYTEAVAYGGRAVDVAREAHDAGAGASAAYAVKGQAEAFAGDFATADSDLAEAEKLERAAVAAPGGEREAAGLKQLLNLRSQVLRQLGMTDEADRLKAEAERP